MATKTAVPEPVAPDPEATTPEPAPSGLTFRNVSPLGALDLPLVGRVVEAGGLVEVPAERAEHLRGQETTWQPVGWAWPEPAEPDETSTDGGEQA